MFFAYTNETFFLKNEKSRNASEYILNGKFILKSVK